jgi:hypothetical protein
MLVSRVAAVALILSLLVLQPASAATCVNKFLAHAEGTKLVVTLLSGKLSYEEARELSRQRGLVEWLDDSGKVVATCAELRAVRPMPVGCDGKTSGVVMMATFLTMRHPSKKMTVKLGAVGAVDFDEQT